MANKYQKYYKEKKSGGVLKTFAAVALGAVLLAGGCAVGFGAGTNWTYKRSPAEAAQPENPQEGTVLSDNVLLTNEESNGIMLMSERIAPEDFGEYGISAQAETAQVLTATFSPANTTFQDVIWSLSGGQGKVVVNPVSGNPLQATVAVTGSFSERATVTCTANVKSSSNETLTATATVDYLKTPTYQNIPTYLPFDSIKSNMTISPINLFDNSTGTLAATRVSGRVIVNTLFRNPSIYSGWKSQIVFDNVDLLNDGLSFTCDMFFPDASESQKAAIYADMALWADGDGADVFEVSYENINYYYGDSGYSYYYEDGEAGHITTIGVLHWNDVITYADSMTLDQSGLVFYPTQA